MYGSVVVAFLFLNLLTRPIFCGDTYWYLEDIYGALRGDRSVAPRIWDFAHLFWRPLGLAGARLFLPLTKGFVEGGERAGVGMILVAFNGIATVLCALGIARWARRITGRQLASSAAAIFFLSTNAVLNYSRSGTPYLLGLAFIVGAALLMSGPLANRPFFAACAGLLTGCAVLVWMPYVVTAPAVLMSLYVGEGDDRPLAPRISGSALPFCASAALLVLFGYGLAVSRLGLSSWSEIGAWVAQSSHGIERQNTLIRMFSGLPRSFVDTGNDAITLKRFLFKDPYAKVTLPEAIRLSMARIALVFAALAAFCFSLWNSVPYRRLAVLLAVAVAPNVAVALMFESGAPERYLPFFPFLFVAIAAVISVQWSGRFLAVACSAMLAFNTFATAAGTVAVKRARQVARIGSLSRARPSDLAFVLNVQDPLIVERYNFSFGAGDSALPALETIFPVSGKGVQRWQTMLAKDVLLRWDKGARVWVTDRVLSQVPRREWNWIEGDDSRISWRQIHDLFSTLDLQPDLSGPDGFVILVESGRNRDALRNFLSAP